LEAAYVFTKFAMRVRDAPDPQLIRRSHSAYVASGGTALVARSGLLDWRTGYHLAGIADALGRFFETREDDRAICDRINQLPTTVADA
jgi:hypothetical protein